MPESNQFYIPTTSWHKSPYGSQRGFKSDDITSLFKNLQWPPISDTIKSDSLGIKTRFYHSYIWYPRPLVMLGVTSCLLTHAAIWLGLPESYSSPSTSLLANLELQWAMGNPHLLLSPWVFPVRVPPDLGGVKMGSHAFTEQCLFSYSPCFLKTTLSHFFS